jgi:peptidoglycan/LPS O-acetylase OafA/YrhL
MSTDNLKRIPSLDGLRAFSILFVLLGHEVSHFQTPLFAYKKVFEILAYFGVTVFFVISGFLITFLLLREYERSGKIDLRAFFKRRAVRILPAVGFYILVIILLGHPDRMQALYSLTFTTSYAFGKAFTPLQHLWSLSVEEQFYLLWPLAFLGGLRSARVYCWLVVAIAPVCRLLLTRHDVYHLFPCVTDSLACGCLLAFYYQPLKRLLIGKMSSAPAFSALCALTVFVGWFLYDQRLLLLWGIVPVLIGIVALIAIERKDYILNCRWVTWTGLLSYSLYLWQQPFLTLHGPFDNILARNICGIAAAILSYYLVEQPALKLFKRKPISKSNGQEVAAVGEIVA